MRKGELLYLPAMWYHRVAQKGVSLLTVFPGCWWRRAKAVVGGGDDDDDDDDDDDRATVMG